MGRRGPLQWKGSKMQWPHGPVQWALTVIGAIDAGVCLVLFVRSGDDFGQQILINLILFGSLMLLSLLYRWADHRPAA